MVKNLNLGNFWTILRSNISKSHIFLKKKVSFKLKVIFGTNSGPKTKKINRAVFEKYIEVSDSGLIWRPLREYLEIKIFFQKSGCVTAVSRKKIVYFHLKKSLVCFSHMHMRKVSLVLVKTKCNNNVNQQQYDACQ